jgi:hypothetical protein
MLDEPLANPHSGASLPAQKPADKKDETQN